MLNIAPYVKNKQIGVCPSDATVKIYIAPWSAGFSYGMLQGAYTNCTSSGDCSLTSDSTVEWPSEYVILGDIGAKDGGGNTINGPTVVPSQEDDPLSTDKSTFRFNYRHLEGGDFLFYDGHVKWQKIGALKQKPNLLRNSNCTTSNPYN
jgi:prepilin-type processing-associated H-X9-DG protein